MQAPTRAQQEQLAALDARLQAARGHDQAMSRSARRHRPGGSRRSPPDPSLTGHFRTIFSPGLPSTALPRLADECSALMDETKRPATRFTKGPVGRAIVLDGVRGLDAGDVGGFGFLDEFTLAGWIRPDDARRGTIVSRMVDEPQGEGYSVELGRRPDPGQPGQALAR